MLIYWHVERGSVVIHSQRLNCSASEVHALVDGTVSFGFKGPTKRHQVSVEPVSA